jgi:hypothetical protein
MVIERRPNPAAAVAGGKERKMNRTYRDVLDAVAADRIPGDLNLLPRFANLTPNSARERRQSFGQTLRSRPALLILVLLVGLALLTGVAYVVGKSMGYLPGVGLVDLSAPVRVLKEPVRVRQEGIIIVLDEVLADATHTVLKYHFDGFPFGPGDFFPQPVLRLENGKELASTGGEGMGWGSESGRINTGSTFPPLPSDTHNAVLVFHKVDPLHKFGPTFDLEVPFSLIPAPKNFVTPGVEIGVTAQGYGPPFQSTAGPTPETTVDYPTDWPPTPTRVPNGTGLYLDKVIEYADSYLLVGNFTDAGDLPGQFSGVGISEYELPIVFTDAKGDNVPAWPQTSIQPADPRDNAYHWAYEIEKPILFPLTLRLDSVGVYKSESATFPFDTGANPHIGQTWKLNQRVILLGVEYIVEKVTMTTTGYTFITNHRLADDPHDFSLCILEGLDNEDITVGSDDVVVAFKKGQIPRGKLTIELDNGIGVSVPGPWTLVWSPALLLK